MGKVFTWKEVVRKRVPQPEDFREVIADARRTFGGEDSIVGAAAFGSVIRGDFTLRSDVDCFVLYDHTKESEAFKVLQSVTAAANAHRVPLTCIPCDTLLAATYMHHIGSSLREHLSTSMRIGGLLKGEPLRHIAGVRSNEKEVEEYLRFKLYGLQEAFTQVQTFSEERFASYLKKMLEAPMHVARKVLAHRGLLHGDSKQEVLASYVQCMERALADQLEGFVALDALYTTELFRQLEHPNESDYRAFLNMLLSHSGKVIAFIHANAMFLVATAR
ncbi:MAG: nucleotidyltransferase domain-containing protein [Candidatus Paceibacterota bacterium]|jgi:predicted nucleotidyltransferase